MSAPITSPQPFTCSSCGFGWSELTLVCPCCGQIQNPTETRTPKPRSILLLSIYTILFGIVGGVFLFMSMVGFSLSTDTSSSAVALLIGLFFMAGAFFWGWHLLRTILTPRAP